MEYPYQEQLLELLFTRGTKGMRLGQIVLYLYNQNNSLFHPIGNYEQFYASIYGFLRRQALRRQGLFQRVPGTYGNYRVRRAVGRQMRLRFNSTPLQ